MQEDTTTESNRSLIRKIFISPRERRLRVGWRLLLHYMLLNIVLVFAGVIIELSLAERGFSLLDLQITPFAAGFQMVVILLVTWFARQIFDRRSFASLGIRLGGIAIRDLLVGFLISAVTITFLFGEHLIGGLATVSGLEPNAALKGVAAQTLIGGLAAYLFVAIGEEVLSRGYHLQNLIENTDLFWALGLSSALFSLLHFLNPHYDWKAALGLTAAGLFLAYGWVRTGSLWLPIGLHFGWNFFEGTVYGFPVSGLAVPTILRLGVTGPSWLTGGKFGPEAGAMLLPALAFGGFLTYLYTRNRKPSKTIQERPPLA
jgi:membrane protease YdiL (CAAX protease family)